MECKYVEVVSTLLTPFQVALFSDRSMEKTGNGGSIVAAIHDDGTPPRPICPILVKPIQFSFSLNIVFL